MPTQELSQSAFLGGSGLNNNDTHSGGHPEHVNSPDTGVEETWDERKLLENINKKPQVILSPSPDILEETQAAVAIIQRTGRLDSATETIATKVSATLTTTEMRPCSLLGDVVRDKRTQANITRHALAKYAQIDYDWLMGLENGLISIEDIRPDYLQSIATALNIPLITLKVLGKLDDKSLLKSIRDDLDKG